MLSTCQVSGKTETTGVKNRPYQYAKCPVCLGLTLYQGGGQAKLPKGFYPITFEKNKLETANFA